MFFFSQVVPEYVVCIQKLPIDCFQAVNLKYISVFVVNFVLIRAVCFGRVINVGRYVGLMFSIYLYIFITNVFHICFRCFQGIKCPKYFKKHGT